MLDIDALCYKYHDPLIGYNISGLPLAYPPRNLSLGMDGMEEMGDLSNVDESEDRVIVVQLVKRMNRVMARRGLLNRVIVEEELLRTPMDAHLRERAWEVCGTVGLVLVLVLMLVLVVVVVMYVVGKKKRKGMQGL